MSDNPILLETGPTRDFSEVGLAIIFLVLGRFWVGFKSDSYLELTVISRD